MPKRLLLVLAMAALVCGFTAADRSERVAVVAPAHYEGAQLVLQPLDALAKQAKRIVVGKVTDVSSFKAPGTIKTRVKIDVDQNVKGKGSDQVTLTLEGGSVGNERLNVGGVPFFLKNEKVLVLLDGSADPKIVGAWQGKYSLAGSQAHTREGKSKSIKTVETELSSALNEPVDLPEDSQEVTSLAFTTYCEEWSDSDVPGFWDGSAWIPTPNADLAVGFEVNSASPGSGGPTGSNFARVIYNSWHNWQALTNSHPSFSYIGTTSRNGTDHLDGNNTVAWANLGSGTLGINYCATAGGVRVDSDTLISNTYTWDYDYASGGITPSSAFSLEAVLEHELGHGLGLGHSDQTCDGSSSTPLMCPAVSNGVRKTIKTDDSNGAASRYPISGGAPGAPASLTVTGSGSSRSLSWTASSGTPLAYDIERRASACTGSATWVSVATVDSRTYGYDANGDPISTSAVTSFADNNFGGGLPAGTYCYRIKALGAGGDSGYSNSAEPGASGPGTPVTYAAGAAKNQVDAIAIGSQTAVFARTTDDQLWYRQGSGTSFGVWTQAGSDIASRPAATQLGSDLYVFYRDTGYHLKYALRTGSTWQPVESLGGTFQAAPVAAVDGDGTLFVAVVTSSGSIWYKALTGSTWSGWMQIPGYLSSTGQLAVTTYQGDVYLAGVHPSGRTYVTHWDRTAEDWTAWTNLAGVLMNEVTIAPFGSSLYVMGTHPSGSTWYQAYDGSDWDGSWTPLAGVLGPRPSAVATTSRLLYFGTQSAGRLYTRSLTGSWSGWLFLGDSLATGPRGVAVGSQAYVFATSTSGHLAYRLWDGASWSDWNDLGGGLAVGD